MSAARVLVAASALAQPMGGARRHAAEILPRAARLLEAHGGRLVLLEGSGGLPFEMPVERLPSNVPAQPPLVRALLESAALRRALTAARAAGRPFDLVHTAHLPAPRAMGVPFTILLHSSRAVSRPFGRVVLRDALHRAAVVLAVSESLRQELLALGAAPERTLVVPNAADHLAIHQRHPGEDAALLHVGHVEPNKNLALLLRALALDPSLPALWLAGEPKHGEDRRLRRLARRLGVELRVRFLGLVGDDQLAHLYSRAACVVLPSLRESFDIPALEACRAGAPLAVSNLPALLEVAGPDVPHFDPRDPAACARAIRTAMETPAAELARAAERAMAFTWDRSAGLLVDAWCGAVHRGAG
ncbi:MAG TPA: glycosyltransferase [Planctomycetota bacterium]|nr:glycosyltransferase [Planctomycetota bacterium]